MQKEKKIKGFDYSCFYKGIFKVLGAIIVIFVVAMNFHSLMQLTAVKIALYIIALPFAIAILAFIKWLLPFEKLSWKWVKSFNDLFIKWDKIFTENISNAAKQHEEFILGDVTEKVGCFSDWIAFMLKKTKLSEDKVQKVYVKTVNFSPLSFLLSIVIAIVLIVKAIVAWVGDLVKPLNWFFRNFFRLFGIIALINFIKQTSVYKKVAIYFSNFAEKHPIWTATFFGLGLFGFILIIEVFAISGGAMMVNGHPIIGSILYSGKVFTVPYMVDYYRKYRPFMVKAEYFAHRENAVIGKYSWMKGLSYYKTVVTFMDHVKNTVSITTKKILDLVLEIYSRVKFSIMHFMFGIEKAEVSSLTFREKISYIMQKEESILNKMIMLPSYLKVSISIIAIVIIMTIAQYL